MSESFWSINGKILFSQDGKAIFDDHYCCVENNEAVFVNMVEFNQPNFISYAAGNVPSDYRGQYDEDDVVQGTMDETPDIVRKPMPYLLKDIVIPQSKSFTLETNWEEYRIPWMYTIKLEQGTRIGYICGCKQFSYDYQTGYVPSDGTWVQSTYVYYKNTDINEWENITYILNYPNKSYKSTYIPNYNNRLLYYSPVSGYYIFEDEDYNSGIITVDSIITPNLSTVTKDILSTYSYYNKDNFTIPLTFSNTLQRGQLIDVINYSNSDLTFDDRAAIITGQITEYPGSSYAKMEHVDGSKADDLYSNYDPYNDGATLLQPRNTAIKEQTQYYFLEFLTGGTEGYCYSSITPSACLYLNTMYLQNKIGGRDNIPQGDQYVNFVNDHVMFTKEGNISTYLIGDGYYEGTYYKKVPVTNQTINSYQIIRDVAVNNWTCSYGITGMLNDLTVYLQGQSDQYFTYYVEQGSYYQNLFYYNGSIYLMNYNFINQTCNVYVSTNEPITNLNGQNVLTSEIINVYYSNENGFYYTKNDEINYINKMIKTHLRVTRLPNYNEQQEVDLPDNDYDWENYGTSMQFTLPIYYDTFNGYYFYDDQNNLIPYNYISGEVDCIYKKGSSDEVNVNDAWRSPDDDYVYIKINDVESSVYWNRTEGFYVHDEDDWDVHINVNSELTANMSYWYEWYKYETGDYVYDNITPVITGSGGSFDIKLYENVYRNSQTGRYYFYSYDDNQDWVPFYISNSIEPKFKQYFYDNITDIWTEITDTIRQPGIVHFTAHLLILALKYVGYYYFDIFWDDINTALKHPPSRYYTGLYFYRYNTTYYIYKNPKYHTFEQGSYNLTPNTYYWILGTQWNTLSCFTSDPHKQLTINEGYYINYGRGFKPLYHDSSKGWWMPIKNGDVIASTFIEHNSETSNGNTPPSYYYESDNNLYCNIESGKYILSENGVDCSIIRPINYYEVEFGYPINEYTRSGKCGDEQYRWITKYKYKNNNPFIKHRKFSYEWGSTIEESDQHIVQNLTVADVLNDDHLIDRSSYEDKDTFHLYDSVIEPVDKFVTKNNKFNVNMIRFKKMTDDQIESVRNEYNDLYDIDEIKNDLTNVNSINCQILTALWLSKGTHPFRVYINLDYNTTDGYFCKNPFKIDGNNLTHLSHGELSNLTDGNETHNIQWSNDSKVYYYELNSTCTILTTNILSAQLNYKSDIYYSVASSMYYCYNPYNPSEIISGIVEENLDGEKFFDTDGEEYDVEYNTSRKKFYYTKNNTKIYLQTENTPLFKGRILIGQFKHSVYGFSDKFAVNYGIRKQGYKTKTFNFNTNYMFGFNVSNYNQLIQFLKNDTSPVLVGYIDGKVWDYYYDGQDRWQPYPWRDVTKSVQPITATVRDYFSSISSLFDLNANYVTFRDNEYINQYQFLSFFRPISTSSSSGDSEDTDVVDGSTFVPNNTYDF